MKKYMNDGELLRFTIDTNPLAKKGCYVSAPGYSLCAKSVKIALQEIHGIARAYSRKRKARISPHIKFRNDVLERI